MKIINKIYLLFLFCFMAAGCSSGGSVSSIDTPVPAGTVTVSLNISKNSLSPGESTQVKAVFTRDGKLLAGQPVTFTATPGLATVFPSTGSAITNQSGEASITLFVNNKTTGVGQVTVSATVNGAPISQIANFYIDTTTIKLDNLVFSPTVVTVGESTYVTVDIKNPDGSLYVDQNVDVYFSAQYGWFETNNAVGRVRSSGGHATSRYRVYENIPYKITDVIKVTFGASTLTGYLTVNPAPVVPGAGSGSLALAVSPANAKPGDFVTVTATYSNTDSSLPISGVPVSIVSSRPDILSTTPAVTNTVGIAKFNMQVASAAQSGSIVSIYASSGTVMSDSTKVTIEGTVADVAVLKLTMQASATWVTGNTGVVLQGNNVTFKSSQGVPITNKKITLSATLVDGYISPFTITLNGTRLSDSATPVGTVDVYTDTTGTATIPTLIEGAVQSNYVIYWRAATDDGYVSYASTLVTVPTPPAPVVPSLPGSPIIGVAAAITPTSVQVTFAPPAYTGTSAITGYTVTASPNVSGLPDLVIKDLNAGTLSTTHTLTGLKSGTSYTFYVYATNSSGNGTLSSPSNSITTSPSPPVIGAAYLVNATTADVTFTAPVTGSAGVVGYTVVASPATGGVIDNQAGTLVTVADPSDLPGTYRHRIIGLTTGLPYTFSVYATTAAGNSSYSAPTNSVTPIP